MTTYIKVLVAEHIAYPLTYKTAQGFYIRQYVTVPFRNKTTRGVVVGTDQPEKTERIKDVEAHYTELPAMPETLQRFIEWVANYTMSPIGALVRTAIPAGVLSPPKKPIEAVVYDLNNTVTLSAQQQQALDVIKTSKSPVLLDGITGSGKTEVYLEAIADVLAQGKQALVLLPEIALSVQMTERFTKRFGKSPAVWHSQMTTVQRQRTWQAVAANKASIVIGARSALFLPFQDLGVIVIDEEHDGTYKQEEQVLYNARDMAVVRAGFDKAKLLLVSATPSLETLHNVEEKKYTVAKLDSRYNAAQLPDISLVDLRQERLKSDEWLSATLIEKITENIAADQQTLLFLNRRGYAPLTLCRTCGFRWQCPSCSAYLVRHNTKRGQFLQCHHCGYGGKMPPACPQCDEKENIVSCGPGIERLAEQVSEQFPEATVLVLSSDAMQNRKQAAILLEKIHNNEADIIIGTQVIAKGHHFPNLTLVGVVDGDAGLAGNDPRAAEKTWQLLHQVAGRAGREAVKGEVLIQTSIPDHPVMQTLLVNDRDAFIATQKTERRDFNLPPYCRLAAVLVKGKNEQALMQYCQTLARSAPIVPGITILGPAPAALYRLRGFYRVRFLIRCNKNLKIQEFIKKWLPSKPASGMQIQVDIDPYNFF